MLEAVLFDLDNTMVLYNEELYLEKFFDGLHPYFSDLFSMDELFERVVATTLALRDNRGERVNLDFFLDRFCTGPNGRREEVWRRFMAFYDEAFHAIDLDVCVPPGMAEMWRFFEKTDLRLVLASNPVFPRIAQEKRMAWGGVDPGRFHFFTHIENMSSVKPHPEYYRETCRWIGVAPEACLMVGNDPVADMAAARVGIFTYLATDASDRGCATLSPTHTGTPAVVTAHRVDFTGPLAGVPSAVAEIAAAGESAAVRLPG